MNQGWSKSTKILVGICLGIFLMCMGSCAFLKHFFAPSKDALIRVASPDGKYDAVLVSVDGGATTGFVNWVCVVPKGSNKFNSSVYVADVTYMKGEYKLSWEGETLVISVPENVREFKRLPSADLGWWRSVAVKYW